MPGIGYNTPNAPVIAVTTENRARNFLETMVFNFNESEASQRMREVDDWELVAQAQAGDANAFAMLVRRYQAPVIHFCRRMLGSPQDAEDIAQECFVRLHRHLWRIQPKAQFSTMLFGIARNLTINALRDAARRPPRADTDDHAAPRAGMNADPARQAQAREIESALEQGMAKLSPEHREALLLREFQGMDYAAMAQVMRCRIGTVRSRLARAREALREHLLAQGDELL